MEWLLNTLLKIPFFLSVYPTGCLFVHLFTYPSTVRQFIHLLSTFLCVHQYICSSVSPTVLLSICPSVICPYAVLSISIFVHLIFSPLVPLSFFPFVHLSMSLSICPLLHVSIWLVNLFIPLAIYLSILLAACLSSFLLFYLSTYMFICLSICPAVCPFFYLLLCQYICTSFHLYVSRCLSHSFCDLNYPNRLTLNIEKWSVFFHSSSLTLTVRKTFLYNFRKKRNPSTFISNKTKRQGLTL
jgi:hypothetical protein